MGAMPTGFQGAEPALVHDYLLVMRGAERTFSAMAECFPSAPIYTTLYCAQGTQHRFSERTIKTSALQRLRVKQGGFRRLLPLYPSAVERLPVQEHPVLLSSSSAFAHGVRPAAGATHICFCHNTFRYAWHEREVALAEVPKPVRWLAAKELDRIRRWDLAASKRVTHYLAGSHLVKDRIARFYSREAQVVHPPVDVDRFAPGEPEDFFLVVCELVRHKRVDTALEAARAAGQKLRVVGDGPERARLEVTFPEASFCGRVDDEELAGLYARALALIVPNVEEFGIAAVEAQAAGRPVLARDSGGTRETVVDGKTGVLVSEGSVDQLAEALREVDFRAFSPALTIQQAARFSRRHFQQQIRQVLETVGS